MKPAHMITMVACIAVLAVTAPTGAQDSAPSMVALARARAEAPPDPPVERPDLRDVPTATRLFYMTGGDNAVCVRAINDVTGDGLDEIIYGLDIFADGDNLYCIDGASSDVGTIVWSLETSDGASGGYFYGDQALVPIVSDPDGDGYQNFLAGTGGGGRTAYNFNGFDGEVVWKFDTYLEPESGWVYSLAELNDITGDGVPEVAFGAGSDNDTVYLVDGASSLPGQATVIWQRLMTNAVMAVRNIGDVNGDGDHDVLLGIGDEGEVVVCMSGGSSSPSGTILWQYPTGTYNNVWSVGVIPDITGDGIAEALAVLWPDSGGAIRCLNGATGALVWQSSQVNEAGMMVDILDDITGDGHDEIIVSSWENAVIVLNGLTGAQVWKTTVGTLNGGDVWTARAIDDLNGDGAQDVIAGSFDYYVYAMDGTDGTILWNFFTNNRVLSVYPVSDLTGDGISEVAVGTQDTTNNIVVHVLDGGAAAVPDFTLAATPDSFQICAGVDDAEYTVTVGEINGFANPVTLAATGNPVGSTTAFIPNPVTPPGTSQFIIGNTAGAPGGSSTVTISGTADDSPGHTVNVTLDVVVPAPPPTLITPPDGAAGQPLRPTFQWTSAAGAASYWLEVDDDPGFGSPAIFETGVLGTTFTPSTDLEADTNYSWRVRSENPCGAGPASTVFSFTTESAMPFADGFESGDTSAWSATVP